MEFLEFPRGKISMVYGVAASGKTTVCLQFSLEIAKEKKVLFIDSEEGFSIERIKQMNPECERYLENILVFRVKNFEEQIGLLNKIEYILKSGNFGLLVIDSIGMHYRKALQDRKYSVVNKEMVSNMRLLTHVAEDFNIPIILTNQVYTNQEGQITHVGGRMLKGFAKYLVELKREPRRACILKPEEKEKEFKITDKGVVFKN
jgi:DNA repair protein RadB